MVARHSASGFLQRGNFDGSSRVDGDLKLTIIEGDSSGSVSKEGVQCVRIDCVVERCSEVNRGDAYGIGHRFDDGHTE